MDIPDNSKTLQLNRALLVTGKICSGKSTLVKAIAQRMNWPVAAFGTYIRRIAKEQNLPLTRASYQSLGKALYKNLGPQKFTIEVIKDVVRSAQNDIVVDGVRHIVVLKELQEIFRHVFIVYLEVNRELRYERFLKRLHSGDPNLSFNEFLEMDTQPVESEIELIKFQASLIVDYSYPTQIILNQITQIINSQQL